MNTDQLVEKYVALRDKKAEIKKRQTEELSRYDLAMSQLEVMMLDILNATGAESMRTNSGTMFKTMRTSTKVMDWSATLEFIKTNNAWDLLEARVSKVAVEAIMAETQQPIPGVATNREIVLNVRRS